MKPIFIFRHMPGEGPGYFLNLIRALDLPWRLIEDGMRQSLPLQKLLQLVQDKTYFPLGASTPMSADIRLIAATHRDLAEAVNDGRFRGDLFYRLAVVHLTVPALRERPGDVGPLIRRWTGDRQDFAAV